MSSIPGFVKFKPESLTARSCMAWLCFAKIFIVAVIKMDSTSSVSLFSGKVNLTVSILFCMLGGICKILFNSSDPMYLLRASLCLIISNKILSISEPEK